MSRKMCNRRKNIFVSSNEMLCTDWWASTTSGPSMVCAEMQNDVSSLAQLRTTCWHKTSDKPTNMCCL